MAGQGAAIRNVICRVGGDVRPLQQSLGQAQRSMRQFGQQANSSLSIAKTAIVAFGVAAAAAFVAVTKKSVAMAMEYEASLQQINRILGANANEFIKWSNEQATMFNMSRSEAIKYGAVYGNLISSITADSSQISNYTQQLLKTSAVVASATGREMTDVMDRIRSGLLGNTEAIEDLGINVNVAMIESTEAFKKFANGQSWQQLSFQTQQQIRLFAILEQSTKKYGNEVNQNTASSLARLTATLKDVQLNLGQAFLPIVNIVVPVLVSFAENLKYVTGVISQFMQALFGMKTEQTKSVQATSTAAKAQTNLGNAIKKAGDKAKKGVAGFDEVNQLQEAMADNAEDAVGVTGGIGDVASVSPVAGIESVVPSGMAEAVAKFKEAIASMQISISEFYNNWGVKDVVSGIKTSLIGLGTSIDTFINTSWELLKTSFQDYMESDSSKITFDNLKDSIKNVGNAISTAFGIGKTIIDTFTTGLTSNKDIITGAFTSLISGATVLGSSMIEVFTSIVRDGIDVFDKALTDNKDFLDNAFSTSMQFAGGIIDGLGEVFKQLGLTFTKVYDDNIGPVKELISTAINDIADVFNSLIDNVIKPLFLPVIESIKPVVEDVFPTIRDSISGAIGDVIAILKTLYDEYLKPIITYISETMLPAIKPTMEEIGKIFKGVFESAMHLIGNLFEALKGLTTFLLGAFTGDWGKAWDGLKLIFKSVWESLVDIMRIPLNSIVRGINKLFDDISAVKFDIPTFTNPITGTVYGGGSIGFPKIPHIPEIPALAKGGIISSPTLAMVGEAGTEAVVPLENTSFIDTLASAIGNVIVGAQQFNNSSNQPSGSSEVVLKLDGSVLGRTVLQYINKEQGRIGINAILQTT